MANISSLYQPRMTAQDLMSRARQGRSQVKQMVQPLGSQLGTLPVKNVAISDYAPGYPKDQPPYPPMGPQPGWLPAPAAPNPEGQFGVLYGSRPAGTRDTRMGPGGDPRQGALSKLFQGMQVQSTPTGFTVDGGTISTPSGDHVVNGNTISGPTGDYTYNAEKGIAYGNGAAYKLNPDGTISQLSMTYQQPSSGGGGDPYAPYAQYPRSGDWVQLPSPASLPGHDPNAPAPQMVVWYNPQTGETSSTGPQMTTAQQYPNIKPIGAPSLANDVVINGKRQSGSALSPIAKSYIL